MKAILYIGHGTRSKIGAAEAKLFIESVMERVHAPIQEMSFLELTAPSIEEGFERCVQEGASSIHVVPLFLLAAGHIKVDIPEALKPLAEKYPGIPIHTANPFGVQERILDAIQELVYDTAGSTASEDSVLIVGRGSSEKQIHDRFADIARGIQSRLNVHSVRVCYLAAASPSFQDGMASIVKEAKGRIIVIPYLLFGGLLLAEVNREVSRQKSQGADILQTGALSGHKAIREIVIERASQKEDTHAAIYH
ncbi:sirohydrochlorin chelatase [Peribacillus kribbensis]|uniref:sirohydrochlorin chelatase n=1 Tax=Peribacillus kribbensis TaxID=356658 RepID=UPI0004088147|nr:sirohydrochlorin chelatase [Peribacillus kribbensis]